MGNHIVYIDRSVVRDGKVDELKSAMTDLVDFVEANEPEILAYDVYFNTDEDRMTVVHMHADQATLEYHMEVAGPKFPPIGELIELESIDVYGHPGEDLIQQLRAKAAELGSGRVSVHDHHRGVDRAMGE